MIRGCANEKCEKSLTETLNSPTSIVVVNTLLNTRVARSSTLPLTGLNLITDGVSKCINVKSDDVNVAVNLFGYYVNE